MQLVIYVLIWGGLLRSPAPARYDGMSKETVGRLLKAEGKHYKFLTQAEYEALVNARNRGNVQ